jgi:hypothetical protein
LDLALLMQSSRIFLLVDEFSIPNKYIQNGTRLKFQHTAICIVSIECLQMSLTKSELNT